MSLRCVVAVLFSSLTTVACIPDAGTGNPDPGTNPNTPGDPPNPDPDGDGMTSPSEFISAVVAKDCADAFSCKESFPSDAGVTFEEVFGDDEAACRAESDAAEIDASVTAGRIEFDAVAAMACIAGLAAAAADCNAYWNEGPEWPAACDTVIAGKVADGGACTIDWDCTNLDAYCEGAVCTAAPGEPRRRGDARRAIVAASR